MIDSTVDDSTDCSARGQHHTAPLEGDQTPSKSYLPPSNSYHCAKPAPEANPYKTSPEAMHLHTADTKHNSDCDINGMSAPPSGLPLYQSESDSSYSTPNSNRASPASSVGSSGNTIAKFRQHAPSKTRRKGDKVRYLLCIKLQFP